MEWEAWDVAELKGAEAQIEIVDEVTGEWGHITVDQIVQSDRSFVVKREDLARELEIEPVPTRTDAAAGDLADAGRHQTLIERLLEVGDLFERAQMIGKEEFGLHRFHQGALARLR